MKQYVLSYSDHTSQSCSTEMPVHTIGLLCRSVAVASRLAYDMLSALSYMNSVGLVHRNLSPNNVLFDHQVLCGLVFIPTHIVTDFYK